MNYVAYTDGACKGNGKKGARGGWAYVLLEEEDGELYLVDQDYDSMDDTTNQRMELLAALNAVLSINSKIGRDEYHKCTIYSDSAYLVRCYNEGWYRKWRLNGWTNSSGAPVANKDLWEELIPFFEDRRYSFQKVKAHTGANDIHSVYNNQVDIMAQQAALHGKVVRVK